MTIPGERIVKRNRHPNTDGTPWGWIDEYVKTAPGSYYRWTEREIRTWSGHAEEAQAFAEVAAHNAALVKTK